MIARIRCDLMVLGALLTFAAPASGDHPLHATRTTVEFNAETCSFEVSMCVFPDDLSQALSDRAGRKIVAENAPDLDQLSQELLRDEFQLRINHDPPRVLQWLGHEFETQQAWLYFEFPLDDASPFDIQIENSILMNQFADQINVAYVRIGERQRCLTFRTDTATWQPWKVTRENAAPVRSNTTKLSD